jgi:hypothetical protein
MLLTLKTYEINFFGVIIIHNNICTNGRAIYVNFIIIYIIYNKIVQKIII